MHILSRVDPKKRIASVINVSQLEDYRLDLCEADEALQVSGRRLSAGLVVPAHRHNPQKRETNVTSEAWVIVSGLIECDLFDVDNQMLETRTLAAGDCIVFFKGGHSLRVLSNDTRMYEFKNGPYFGATRDKENI